MKNSNQEKFDITDPLFGGLEIVAIGMSFDVGTDDFKDLEINSTAQGNFYYFINKKNRRLIKEFVLNNKLQVNYVCQVALIKKGEKFTPRLTFSIRDKMLRKIVAKKIILDESTKLLKASISLNECHENFWKLIDFLQSLQNMEIPKESFSLLSKDVEQKEYVSAIQEINSRN